MTELSQLDLQLLSAYRCNAQDSSPYLQTHYERYLTTLREIGPVSQSQVLELGANPPYSFSLMLRNQMAGGELILAQGREDLSGVACPPARELLGLESSAPGFPNQEFVLWRFNAESDVWPFAAGSLDLVICMEVLEHLLLDPLFLFLECQRVLRPGGRFVVTTPNLGSLEGILGLLNNRCPYRFGLYSPYGPYGRHNREYVPWEVELLGTCAGFQPARLHTFETYPVGVQLDWVRSLVELSGGDLAQCGQTIYYEGVKRGAGTFRYPPELFAFDPGVHVGKVRLAEEPQFRSDQGGIPVLLECTNQGRCVWSPDGQDTTNIGIQLLDSCGSLIDRDFMRVALPRVIAPGESTQVHCIASLPEGMRECRLKFDMVHEGVCWYSEQPNSPSRSAEVLIRR